MKAAWPRFQRTAHRRALVKRDRDTAALIRAIWAGTSQEQRREARFLFLLAQMSWVNRSPAGKVVSRAWRNRQLAAFFKAPGGDEPAVANALSSTVGGTGVARALLKPSTGITRYYGALRPALEAFIDAHQGVIGQAFADAADVSLTVEQKIDRVYNALMALPRMKLSKGRTTSALNGLSPALACLDPRRRLPIVNALTTAMLRRLGHTHDAVGAKALVTRMKGLGLHDSFELDVYASTQFKPAGSIREPLSLSPPSPAAAAAGPKSEEPSYVDLARRRLVIEKRHNILTNGFASRARERYPAYGVDDKGTRYDIRVAPWRDGRELLIEAKPTCAAAAGRMQVRTAVGQLLDYRATYFPQHKHLVTIAVLLPSEPPNWVKDLLAEVRGEVFWLTRTGIEGTTKF